MKHFASKVAWILAAVMLIACFSGCVSEQEGSSAPAGESGAPVETGSTENPGTEEEVVIGGLEKLDDFINFIKENKNIEVEGVYTHLSSANEDFNYTKLQLEKFQKAIEKVRKNFNIKYIHCLASNGIINFNKYQYNLVRPGIIMYGYESGDGIKEKMDLKPVCTLKSKITYIKEVDENTSISYGRRFITKRKSKIATVPLGYVDGLKRILSNVGEVVINNIKAPIIGSICMDSFMVDITDIKDVKYGDDVYIWDNNLITLNDIAKKCDTINYEILSTIGKRVPRVFIKN